MPEKPLAPAIEVDQYIPIRDHVYIEADKYKKVERQIAAGKTIIIDTLFRPHERENATQDGIVHYVAKSSYTGRKIPIEPGDHVYTHHFLCDIDQGIVINGVQLYALVYPDQIYCIVRENGDIEMLDEWLFLEPVYEEPPSDTIEKPELKKDPLKGIIRHTNTKLSELGVKEGDLVYFSESSDYEMDVEGKTYYRMKNEDIIGLIG